MAEKTPEQTTTEPVTVPCLFVSGYALEFSDTWVRFVGFVDLPPVGYSGPERRIVVRTVMAASTAREIMRELRKSLHRPTH